MGFGVYRNIFHILVPSSPDQCQFHLVHLVHFGCWLYCHHLLGCEYEVFQARVVADCVRVDERDLEQVVVGTGFCQDIAMDYLLG